DPGWQGAPPAVGRLHSFRPRPLTRQQAERQGTMTRQLAGLLLGLLLTASPSAGAADEPALNKLTPQQRTELEAEWRGLTNARADHVRANRLREARQAFTQALALARRLYPATEFPRGHPELAQSLSQLARVVRPTDAEALYREAVAMSRRLSPRQGD